MTTQYMSQSEFESRSRSLSHAIACRERAAIQTKSELRAYWRLSMRSWAGIWRAKTLSR